MIARKSILFVIFDFSDVNYKKMPWRYFTETIPLLAKRKPNYMFYILTDTKNVDKLRKIIENNNVKIIPVSKPILRYPYKGLLFTINKLLSKLKIETFVILSGWNLGLWIRLARKLKILNIVLITFLPLYRLRELLLISLNYMCSLLRAGTIKDLVVFIKLIFENSMIRLSVKTLPKHDKYVRGIIVASKSSESFFKRNGLKSYLAVPKLRFNGLQNNDYRKIHRSNRLSLAYFGPIILARGYDIVVNKMFSERFNITVYSRDKLNPKIYRKNLFSESKKYKNIIIIEKFFKNMNEIINETKKHDLVMLPFRFVVSDVPLIVLELACSGKIIVTTKYSHIERQGCPNLIFLDLKELKNPNTIKRLVYLDRKMRMKPIFTIDWNETAKKLLQVIIAR